MLSRSLLWLSIALLPSLLLAEPPKDARDRIVGMWNSLDRHAGIGVHADHAAITGQERWKDGRTEFRAVRFADDMLSFEFDIAEWRTSAGPIAVEEKRIENAGTIRVEAKLTGDRLVGKWGMFLKDGTEVFRGEWEAMRSKAEE